MDKKIIVIGEGFPEGKIINLVGIAGERRMRWISLI